MRMRSYYDELHYYAEVRARAPPPPPPRARRRLRIAYVRIIACAIRCDASRRLAGQRRRGGLRCSMQRYKRLYA
jgi:hypothetical protein